MFISFYRGDNHREKFRFKSFKGNIDNVFFTVKCKNRIPRIKKKLNDGIEFKEGWYCIEFIPSDTDELECNQEMVWDIEIIVNGEKYTVKTGTFLLKEDITTPDCEV